MKIKTSELTGMALDWAVMRCIYPRYEQRGPAPLIAAMRCYVASKLGNEIDIPEELIK